MNLLTRFYFVIKWSNSLQFIDLASDCPCLWSVQISAENNYPFCLKENFCFTCNRLGFDKVKSFARKTGDFASLSETDILLIAIAYTIIE